jgi:hypothetical protein
MIIKKTHIISVIVSVLLFGMCKPPLLSAQEIDLNHFINDSTYTNVDNLSAAFNSGLSNSLIQAIHALNPLQVNLSFNKVWTHIAEDRRTGALSNTKNVAFPVVQVEVGLPQRIHLIGRGMSFEIGETEKERAVLWGVGARYSMFQDSSNVRTGIVAFYEELNKIDDFDIKSLVFQGYIGYQFSHVHVYVAPVAVRSTFHIHLTDAENPNWSYNESRVESYLKFSAGAHIYITSRLYLTGNVVLGEYAAIGLGGSIRFF